MVKFNDIDPDYIKSLVINNSDKVPDSFHWKSYVSRYEDLRESGIDNEILAKFHYIYYGNKENREYHKLHTIYNPIVSLPDQSTFKLPIESNKTLTVSILLYYPDDISLNFLSHFPKLLINKCYDLNIKQLNLVIRNNSNTHNEDRIKEIISDIQYENTLSVNIHYINSYNKCYGSGHNSNFNIFAESDYFLIVNDDMGFPHINWLNSAIYYLESGSNFGMIGAYESPHILSDFADGKINNSKLLTEPEYAEGSIILIKSNIFNRLGGFDERIKYFYFEDADLSLRAKQLGYKIGLLDMPHQHFRNSSTKKISNQFKSSIVEYNRAYFFSKWKNYMNTREIQNKILIDLSFDGIGDIVDCFYPVKTLLSGIDHSTHVDMIVHEKIRCLYNYFENRINYIDKSNINFDTNNYDNIFSVHDINMAYPSHTMDLISAKLGLANIDTNETDIKKHISLIDSDLKLPKQKYIVLHLDSQRTSFHGRIPGVDIVLSILKKITGRYNTIIIGQSDGADPKIQEVIAKSKTLDYRDSSVSDIFKIINSAECFIGLDSGPSHIAQLLNIPSFILYGPINPATKIYRYHNSGCYYNTDPKIVSGSYHVHLEPAYHFDIRHDNAFFDVDPNTLTNQIVSFISNKYKFDWMPIFESLRQNQRESLITQMHNPILKNKILTKQPIPIKSMADSIMEIVGAYERYSEKTNIGLHNID